MILAFNSEVSKEQLKQYADVVCFSQVGVDTAEISERLDLPEYLVSAWVRNWRSLQSVHGAVHG